MATLRKHCLMSFVLPGKRTMVWHSVPRGQVAAEATDHVGKQPTKHHKINEHEGHPDDNVDNTDHSPYSRTYSVTATPCTKLRDEHPPSAKNHIDNISFYFDKIKLVPIGRCLQFYY